VRYYNANVVRQGKRQSRSVTFVYGGIAGIMLVTIATIALVVAPPSPPSVAEFAPSAEKQIDQAPQSQSSRFGNGAGGACAPGQVGCEAFGTTTTAAAAKTASPSTTAAPGTIVKARVRRCVGDPPRQTEDPQSPPCVNYWQGDNGGATTKGVTRDEIRVGLGERYGPSESDRVFLALVDHFNRRYELYGRKFTPVFVSSDGSAPAQQRADAEAADSQVLFAVVGAPGGYDSDLRPYWEELARRGIVTADTFAADRSASDLNTHGLLSWTYGPTVDSSLAATASWACSSLVGRPARFASPPLTIQQRAFAVVRMPLPGGRLDVSPLTRALERCGATDVRTYDLPDQQGATETDPAARATVATMQADGRTTIICPCGSAGFERMFPAAANSHYDPEWVTGGFYAAAGDRAGGVQNARATRIFGVSPANKPLPPADTPWIQAVRESEPTIDITTVIPDETNDYAAVYHALLLLASGVQAAGPRLTPAAFDNGLTHTSFSNPGAGGPPFFQGHVGFSTGNHSMLNDFTVVYKDANASPGTTPPTGYCYVRRGTRWSSTFPDTEAELFDTTKPCR
jgi:hypothetical protein